MDINYNLHFNNVTGVDLTINALNIGWSKSSEFPVLLYPTYMHKFQHCFVKV